MPVQSFIAKDRLFICKVLTQLLPPLGGAASEIQEMRVAEAAFQAEEASSRRLLPHGPSV